jgi:hypothetical protein
MYPGRPTRQYMEAPALCRHVTTQPQQPSLQSTPTTQLTSLSLGSELRCPANESRLHHIWPDSQPPLSLLVPLRCAASAMAREGVIGVPTSAAFITTCLPRTLPLTWPNQHPCTYCWGSGRWMGTPSVMRESGNTAPGLQP